VVPFSSATSTSLAGAGLRSVATCSGSASAGTAMALAQRFSERWGHQRCGQLQTRQACRGGIRFERGHTQPEAMEASSQSGPSTQTVGGISKTGEKHPTMPMTTATTINRIFMLHLLLILSSSWQCYIFFYAPPLPGLRWRKEEHFMLGVRIEAGAFARFTRRHESLRERRRNSVMLINDTKRDL
jgi:hypothetical protein